VAQVMECLLCKHEALISNPSPIQKKFIYTKEHLGKCKMLTIRSYGNFKTRRQQSNKGQISILKIKGKIQIHKNK
jgi:hypothetical protein